MALTRQTLQVDAAYSSPFRADSRMSDNCPGSADVNTVHCKMNSCCLKARNVQVQVQVRVLNHRVQVQVQVLGLQVQVQVQVRQKPDSSPTRVQVQDSSPTTLARGS